MNYFVINAPSNLIINVMASSYTPEDTKLLKFVVANDKSLNTYYKWCKKNPNMCMDIGDLMAKSPHVKEQVSGGRSGAAKLKTGRVRSLPERQHQSREEEVASWIARNPTADEYDLDEALYTGIVAARAYLSKYI